MKILKWDTPNLFKKVNGANTSMRIRLFAFLCVLIAVVICGVAAILLSTGALTVGGGRVEKFTDEQFDSISGRLTAFCGDTDVQLVMLSQSISKDIEYQLSNKQLQTTGLKTHPEILEEVTGNELSRLQFSLEKTNCSGVFMVLDATVNPSLPNAGNSKAGLYIRDTEPKVTDPDEVRYVRGFPWIAYRNGMLLQSQWAMEFDVTGRDFYYKPLEKYNEKPQPLSNLYYWCFERVFPEFDEDTVLCSVPLVDSKGNAFGVCGFEISADNFQANYSPDSSEYHRAFSMFSLMGDAGLDMGSAMFSQDHPPIAPEAAGEPLRVNGGGRLSVYAPSAGLPLVGRHEEIRIYPADSVFAGQRFALSLLMPKEDFDTVVFWSNMKFIVICVILLVLGLGIAFFISSRYIRPITNALEVINPDRIDTAEKTNIREIDQLIERIKQMRSKAKEAPLPDNLFEDFILRVKTLTATEEKIFRYYFEGKRGGEIPHLMFISANTFKTHNKHIFAKLGVASRDELTLYIELIKKSGLAADILGEEET